MGSKVWHSCVFIAICFVGQAIGHPEIHCGGKPDSNYPDFDDWSKFYSCKGGKATHEICGNDEFGNVKLYDTTYRRCFNGLGVKCQRTIQFGEGPMGQPQPGGGGGGQFQQPGGGGGQFQQPGGGGGQFQQPGGKGGQSKQPGGRGQFQQPEEEWPEDSSF